MDPSLSHSPPEVEEDEWGISQPPATTISHQFRTSYEWKALTKDTDGFVIPSLSIGGDSDLTSIHVRGVTDSRPPESIIKEADKIYLGPHGAPPQAKQQELNAAGRKHRFKEKLREADCRFSGAGRENKVESLQQLLGSKVRRGSMPKSSARDWLDPHCHESQFEKYP